MTCALILMRHAKAAWESQGGRDRDRPLKPRGQRAAGWAGRFLAATDQAPACVLTSPAVRARATAELVCAAGGWEAPLVVVPALYETTVDRLHAVLVGADLPAKAGRVLLVGHEPTLSASIGAFTDGAPPRFPTGAMACIDFEAAAWRDVRLGAGQLQWLVLARHLGLLWDG